MNAEQLQRDISVFADLGTGEVDVVDTSDSIYTQIVRNGELTKLTLKSDGTVIEKGESFQRNHASFRALLASENFANLGKWADSQQTLLRARVFRDTIPVAGTSSKTGQTGEVSFFDDHLVELTKGSPRVLVALLDGPAGIGKTSILRALAMRRAQDFRIKQRPLLLHVESRGRMLQNLTDLMAFSLQTLRVSVTYDQVPVLVRHGLITLAIDGFDELGDPNGYDLAWAQVNELITESRGQGNLILAGRETFIGEERILGSVSSIDTSKDILLTFSLNYIQPNTARRWLRGNGWAQPNLESEVVAPIFEEGSYALRPFFLSELARPGTLEQVENGEISNLLSFLIEAMIQREATKFGKDVEAASSTEQRQLFIRSLMEEVARDLADNQTDAVSAENLIWLSEAAASDIFPPALWGLLKNRAGVIAFLTDDDRRGYRRFIHESVNDYFLSSVAIKSVSGNEVPKFMRRNIFGLEFYESFSEVVRQFSMPDLERFVHAAQAQLQTLNDVDRARGNISALMVACACVSELPLDINISDVNIDELWTGESPSKIKFSRTSISQLFAKGADMRRLDFDENSYITTLIADSGTILSTRFPIPTVLSLPGISHTEPSFIENWLRKQNPDSDVADRSVTFNLSEFGLFPLYAKLIRYKPYWLKMDETRGTGAKILEHPHWDILKRLMLEHNLLVERYDVPASGPKEAFYHVRNKAMHLGTGEQTNDFALFLKALVSSSIELEGGASEAFKKLSAGQIKSLD